MTRIRCISLGFLAASLLAPAAALAQNRVDQQVFLELRVIEERDQKLLVAVNTLIEQLKTANTKLDAEAAARTKGFADQETQIKTLSSSLSTLRENVSDTKVQVQKVTQELEALRKGEDMLTTFVTQALAQMPAAPPPIDPNAPPGSAPPTPPGAPTGVPASSKDYYNRAFSDYMSGQWDMAIQGFDEMLKQFPASPDAAQAQRLIGDSYYTLGKYKEAVAAYDKLIKDYKDSDQISDAYYKQGLCYEALKQPDLAIANYQLLRKDYVGTSGELQATQALKKLGVIKN